VGGVCWIMAAMAVSSKPEGLSEDFPTRHAGTPALLISKKRF